MTDLNRPGLRNADEKTKQKTIMKLLSMSSEAYNIKLNINGVEGIEILLSDLTPFKPNRVNSFVKDIDIFVKDIYIQHIVNIIIS